MATAGQWKEKTLRAATASDQQVSKSTTTSTKAGEDPLLRPARPALSPRGAALLAALGSGLNGSTGYSTTPRKKALSRAETSYVSGPGVEVTSLMAR